MKQRTNTAQAPLPRGKVTYKDGHALAARARTTAPQAHTHVGMAHQNWAVGIRNPAHNNETTNKHCARPAPHGKITQTQPARWQRTDK